MIGQNVTALLVDDEFQSRNYLSKLILITTPDLKLVGQADNCEEAFTVINDLNPDIVFLDIMLKNESGFDLLQRFDHLPFEIIFTTASNEYAIKAFKFNALDYLLKPIDREELLSAVTRAKHRILKNQKKAPGQMDQFFETIRGQHTAQNKIAIPTADGFDIMELPEILYCQSSGSYTNFHLTNKRRLTSSYPLKQYDEILSEKNFFRAHKSFLINIAHVKTYRKGEGGTIIMSDGQEIELSRRNKESFIKIFRS
ncbi:MAG: LytR/AlgR family response regulator transcription factor [Chitinophagaceae bacterium]